MLDVNGYYAPAGIVNSLNALSGDVTLSVGTDLTLGTVNNVPLVLGTNASSGNTANTLVRRDVSGNFSASTITANVTGSLTGAASLNVLKAGDTMSGTLALGSGNIDLVTEPSTAAGGSLLMGGERFLHDGGNGSNTFVGANAGNFTMTGALNVGSGTGALTANTLGTSNTAIGADAMFSK